jgi:hypothetical protein
MRTRNALLMLAVILLLPSAAAAQNGDRFQLFGDAQSLTGGLPPNGSVHLTSHCDPYDPVANPAPCNFDVTFSGINYKGKGEHDVRPDPAAQCSFQRERW